MSEPTVVHDFTVEVHEIEHLWIPMPDGCRLAARVWRPVNAEREPVPVILEYIPYRKRDRQAIGDRTIHRYFADHGYAAVRLDVRGTGDSEGLITDEYTAREHDDGVAAIEWLSAQPWCSGAVGMMGISWGGFNSLQVAARRPPALKALISVAASDDRYADDMHYMGGCLLTDTLGWGTTFFGYTPIPPDPAIVGERWREMWLERMKSCPLAVAEWIRHQSRDAYWRHGSVCEDYAAIVAAVYAVGGWADGYTNAIMRLMAHLPGPRKGLIGPWGHTYPHRGGPGPTIGFLQEALRWWDHWLKGIDTGIMEEPMLRLWMQEHETPQAEFESRTGRWVAEPVWPGPSRRVMTLRPNAEGLGDSAGKPTTLTCETPLSVGRASGDWCPYGLGPDLATDQRDDDAQSLTLDSGALDERLEIAGTPRLALEISSDQADAMVAARLEDVAPDGTSVRVSYGLCNLTHRDGHAEPRPLVPGERYRIDFALNDCAYAFPAGHRIRLALSMSYWPIAWPSPVKARLSVFAGAGGLELPVREPREEDASLPEFGPPECAPPPRHEVLRAAARGRQTAQQDGSAGLSIASDRDRGSFRLVDDDWTYGGWGEDTHSIEADDPASARTRNRRRVTFERGELRVAVDSEVALSSTRDAFHLTAWFRASEGDKEVYRRDWDVTIPRQGV